MDKNYKKRQRVFSLFLLLMLLGLYGSKLLAQTPTTINTTHVQNNGANSIMCNVQNTNTYAIVITEMSCFLSTICSPQIMKILID